jgi:hypothetical protein
MTPVSKLRFAALAVIVAGATHLERAEAAPLAASDSCSDYARGYAAGYCAASGGTWAAVAYTCNADGTASIQSVKCHTEVLPPP